MKTSLVRLILCGILLTVSGAGCPSETQKMQVFEGSYQEYSTSAFQAARVAKTPVFLFFYATWCGHCQVQEPKYESLLSEAAGKIQGFRVNVDTEKELKQAYRVPFQTTALFFDKDGVEVGRLVGEQPDETVREFIQKMLN